VEADSSEVAAKLRLEGGSDLAPATSPSPVELVVDGVFRHQREHFLEIVAIESLGEADHKLLQGLALGHG